MSLEMLIFACQRETFMGFCISLHLDRGDSFQDIRIKKKRYAHQVFGNVGNFKMHTQMA